MNYRAILIVATGVAGLVQAPFAAAYMSMFDSYPGTFAQSGVNKPSIIAMDVAIKTAEGQTVGKAYSADLTLTDSGPAYVVEFAGNGVNRNVWVDARNGRVEKTETIPLATFAPGE